jgi:two-component system, OmpR family, sensor histidine kinase TctE
MTAAAERIPSIRRQLLALLLAPAIVVLLAGALSDYLTSISPIRDAYDQALADAALAIATNLRMDATGAVSLELPAAAIALLRTDAVDSIYFRVSAPDGSIIAGDADLPQARAGAENPSREDAIFRGQPIRLVSYRSAAGPGVVTTTVAETVGKRGRVRERLLTTVLGMDFLQFAAILALAWLGVSVALRPLLTLRDQIARRSARELEPLPLASVPSEVRTLVGALNRLFTRISDSNRTQRQFLENAAHQLRTPLAGVQAQLELMIAEEPEPAHRELLQLTLGATQRLAHTTQQLLALARSEHAASDDPGFEVIDLAALAEATVPEHLSRAVAAGIDLGAELAPARVYAVAWLLVEALNNLLDNAITHTPPEGTVTVRCGREHDFAYLEVVDTGVGIAPDERARVTSRFYRGRSARGYGSGLGLAIVADVARLHGAELSIEAGPGGTGTCVRLQFAAAAVAPQARASGKHREKFPKPGRSGLTSKP